MRGKMSIKLSSARRLPLYLLAICVIASSTAAETRPSLNMYGATGLIDMPSGEMQPDGMLTITSSHFGPISRTTLTFQITPRLSGSFRYLGVRDWNKNIGCLPACTGVDSFKTYYDRSFDLRYQVMREGRYLPAVSVGLQDFVGTGIVAGEYVVATKHVTPDLKVTAGLGWGRLGSYGAIGAPFGTRPPLVIGAGGNFNVDQWFRGPAASFGGLEWQINDKWAFKAEYSSDAYAIESGARRTFERKSPFNFGIEYQANERIRLGAYAMHGSEIGVSLSFMAQPKKPMIPLRLTAPTPIKPRPDRSKAPDEWSADWVTQADAEEILTGNIGRQLAVDSIAVHSLSVNAQSATLWIDDKTFDSRANSIGRAARAMAYMLPASIETFRIIPVVKGQPTVAVTVRRSDLEALENSANPATDLWARTQVEDAAKFGAGRPAAELYPKFNWSIGPYVRTSYFDPRRPIRLETGVRAKADYSPLPGLEFAGSLRMPVISSLDDPRPASSSVLPHVRTDAALYDRDAKPGLEYLTVAKYFRPGKDIYGRVSAGYLEPMFAGVSGEVLWKPAASRYALGAELNYVAQRDTDMRFGLQNYKVLTGHLSFYADLNRGYSAQLDVGRYLAGDVGATLSVDRSFDNGWKIGAFATKTNVTAAQFGEGSFDKGIKVTIPLTWITGKPSQKVYNSTLRPVSRDGGARLNVRDRLFDKLKEDDSPSYDRQWGRFWR
jgi:hypothetical protein